jgi:hypothetical protein
MLQDYAKDLPVEETVNELGRTHLLQNDFTAIYTI